MYIPKKGTRPVYSGEREGKKPHDIRLRINPE